MSDIRRLVSTVLIALLGLLGCSPRTGSQGGGSIRVLSQRTIRLSDVGRLASLAFVDDQRLVILERQGPLFLTLVDWRTGRVLTKFGWEGGGPGELSMPYNFHVVAGAIPEVWVLQPNRRLMTRYILGDLPAYANERRFTVHPAVTEALMLPVGLVTTGPRRDSALIAVDDSGSVSPRSWGRPPYYAADLPAVMVFDANDLQMVSNGAQDRIALAFKYASLVQVVDTAGKFVRQWDIPGKAEPRVDPRSTHPVTFEQDSSRVAVTSIASSDSVIAVVNCRCNGTLAWSDAVTRRIELYRWDGTRIGEIPFSRPISAIAISRDGHSLFVATESPEPQIEVLTIAY